MEHPNIQPSLLPGVILQSMAESGLNLQVPSPTKLVLAQREKLLGLTQLHGRKPAERDFSLHLRLLQQIDNNAAGTEERFVEAESASAPQQVMAAQPAVPDATAAAVPESWDDRHSMLANEAQAPKPTAAADAAQPMFEEAQPPAVHATEAQGPSVAQPGLGESRDATGETQLTDAAEPGMGDSRDAGLAAEILAAQQEASKQRLAMISFRTGSWRESTPRGFPLRLMTVYLPPVVRLPPPEQPEPQEAGAAQELPAHKAAAGQADNGAEVQSAGQLTAAFSREEPRQKDFTPLEGVPERPWRSTVNSPPFKRNNTATPVEGVPERDWQTGPNTGTSRLAAVGTRHSFSVPEMAVDPWDDLSPLLVSGRNAAPSVSRYILADSPSMRSSSDATPSLDLAAAGFTRGSFGGDDDDDFEAAEWGDCGGDADALGGNDVDLDGAAAEGTPAQALAVPGAVKGTRPSLHSAQCQTGASLDGRQQSPLSPGHQAPSPVAVEAEPLQAEEGAPPEPPRSAGNTAVAEGTAAKRGQPTETNQRLRRMHQERLSLAGEGMQADGEKRRSTRVRHRPLEWWRMETKVYKRAHNSLPTVDHVVTHTPETVWKTVSGGPRHRKKKQDSEGGARE